MLTNRPLQWSARRGRWSGLVWLLPVGLPLALRVSLERDWLNLYQLLGLALAIPLLILLALRPHVAILLLVLVLPFQLLITSGLYEMGLPGGVVRLSGLWKELAAGAVVVAAFLASVHQHRQIDALDRLALAYVGLGTAYLLIPDLFVSAEAGASLSIDTRFIGWRTMVLPALLLVATRHIRLSVLQLRQVLRLATGVAITLGVVGVFEFVASDTWNTLMVDTLGVNRFRLGVLKVSPATLSNQVDDIRRHGQVVGREIIRVGGPMVDFLQFSFALLIGGSLLLEGLVRGVRTRVAMVGTVLVGVSVLFTQTRSAIVGGVLLAVIVLRPAPGRFTASRVRYTLLVVAAFALTVPLMFGSGMLDRFTAGDPGSDAGHEGSVDAALDVVKTHPMGLGLAMGASAGSTDVEGRITAENHFLDVGVQLGWLGIALAASVLVVIIRSLRSASLMSRDPTIQFGLLAVRGAFIALLVPAWYLQPFVSPEVGWVLFALAGAALGAADAEDPDRRGRGTAAVNSVGYL